MKKIIGTILILGSLMTACHSELDLAPVSEVTADNFYQKATDIEQGVVAAYDGLQSQGLYGQNYMFFMEIRSDNATVESPTNSGGVFGEFDLFSLSASNSVIERCWNDTYETISRCNIVLDRIDEIEDLSSERNNVLKGELKFIRALVYFNSVRIWGGIPLVTTTFSNSFDAFSVGKSSVNEVYSQIITDLTDAVNVLPAANEEGRATKGAANGLLGKVHLTLGNTSEAINALRAVTGYTLLAAYEDNFGLDNENSDESIFEIQFQAGNGEGSPYPNLVAPVGSGEVLLGGVGEQKGENIPTNDLYASFEDGDVRRDISIGDLGTIKYASKLIAPPSNNRDSDVNIIVLRYADILLMLSEALNMQSYVADGEAFDLLNQVRNRAGLASLTSSDLPDQASLSEAILAERRHEFVSENHRWFDLVRTGRAIEVMNASTTVFTVSEAQLVYPIPQSAVDTMNDPTLLGQNPGY